MWEVNIYIETCWACGAAAIPFSLMLWGGCCWKEYGREFAKTFRLRLIHCLLGAALTLAAVQKRLVPRCPRCFPTFIDWCEDSVTDGLTPSYCFEVQLRFGHLYATPSRHNLCRVFPTFSSWQGRLPSRYQTSYQKTQQSIDWVLFK